MKVNIFNIKELYDSDKYLELLNYVDDKKRDRIKRFRRKEDKIRGLVGDALVRVNVCNILGCKNEDIEYEYNQYGKPSIKDHNEIKFNVSHSGDYVVVAIGKHNVGIDIETIDNRGFEDISKRYFHESEHKWIMSQEDKEKSFFKIWTLKESYVKYVGKGLSLGLDTFVFKMENDIKIEGKENLYFENHEIDGKYELSICTEARDVVVSKVNYESLKIK